MTGMSQLARLVCFGMIVHRINIQTRFGDTDALGHVILQFRVYAELARLEFLSRIGDP